MNPIEPNLLRAVLDDPEDDDVRLIAADWWEENREAERAEFVRVQLELASLPKPPASTQTVVTEGWRPEFGHPSLEQIRQAARYHALTLRQEDLLGQYADVWAAPWEGIFAAGMRSQRPVPIASPTAFRRGFIHSVSCTGADWLAHADALLEAQPVREVRLTSFTTSDTSALWNRWVKLHPRESFLGTLLSVALKDVWPGITFHLPSLDDFGEDVRRNWFLRNLTAGGYRPNVPDPGA